MICFRLTSLASQSRSAGSFELWVLFLFVVSWYLFQVPILNHGLENSHSGSRLCPGRELKTSGRMKKVEKIPRSKATIP